MNQEHRAAAWALPIVVVHSATQTREEARLAKPRGEVSVLTLTKCQKSTTEHRQPTAVNMQMEMEEASRSAGENEVEVHLKAVELAAGCVEDGRGGRPAGRSSDGGLGSWLGVVVDGLAPGGCLTLEDCHWVAGGRRGHSCGGWCFAASGSYLRSTSSSRRCRFVHATAVRSPPNACPSRRPSARS